jgi:ABC-type Fe3+-siderophore transport system permease subunit
MMGSVRIGVGSRRSAVPAGIPIDILTAAIGAPLFRVMLPSRRRQAWAPRSPEGRSNIL